MKNIFKAVVCALALTMVLGVACAEDAVVWEGSESMGNWASFVTLTTTEVAEFKADDVITVNFTQDAAGAQLQVQSGDWTSVSFAEAESWGGNNIEAGVTSFSYTVTEDIATQLNGFTNEWGQILQVKGANITVTSVVISTPDEEPVPEDVVVWEGSESMGNWASFVTLTTTEIPEFKAGDVIIVNFTQDAESAQLQVQSGDWASVAFAEAEDWGGNNLEAGATSFSYTVTEDIAAELNGFTNEWGQILQVKGANITVTSIVISTVSDDPVDDPVDDSVDDPVDDSVDDPVDDSVDDPVDDPADDNDTEEATPSDADKNEDTPKTGDNGVVIFAVVAVVALAGVVVTKKVNA